MFDIQNPEAAPGLRWGIIGAGHIAAKFTNAVQKYTTSKVVAVGSCDRQRGERFAASNGIPVSRVGYQAIVEHPHVDAIYVATPHSVHKDHAILALTAGKPVLVEKPFALNANEAQEVFDVARSSNLFAMEAMWTRFLPHMAALRQVLARGGVGQIVHVQAEHGQHFPFDPAHRIFNRDLGGGALLDLGVYPVSFVHNLLGSPEGVLSKAVRTETGVDGQVSAIFEYPGQVQATVSTTLWALSAIAASVTGTEGRIEFSGPFQRPTGFHLLRRDGREQKFDAGVDNGFQYQVAEAARCITSGLIESPLHTHQGIQAVLRTMDTIRAQNGLTYPGEKTPNA